MSVSRIDLADAATPDRLVLEILKHEPDLPIPVPVEALCHQLDISDIKPLQTAGYEGGLITDRDKRDGVILVNAHSPKKRRRFTTAHELCHFLMPSHVPSAGGQFLCSQEDMFRLSTKESDARSRMEVEANRFASRLLLPAPSFRVDVAKTKDPDLQQIGALSGRYDVSKEAVGRAYVEYRDEPVAMLVIKDGILLRPYFVATKFPFLSVSKGSPIPKQSLLLRRPHEVGTVSDLDETDAGVWIDVERGRRAPTLYEQVLSQQQGYALILLTVEKNGDDEENQEDEDRTSKQRYHDRINRWPR
jgi:Zn-dependent peptidase ImmA (M78 family)